MNHTSNLYANISCIPPYEEIMLLFCLCRSCCEESHGITSSSRTHEKKEYRHKVTKEFTLAGSGALSFKHHYRAYCGWSYMMRPFYKMNITQELDNPRFQELASHLDPLGKQASLQRHTEFLVRKRAVMGRRVSEGLIDIHQ
uniref:Uncharacterized protein n=1 Tax=Sphaerodactylus townsendi TaxID=933632 RepID=A0ACB8FG39_9SAUR